MPKERRSTIDDTISAGSRYAAHFRREGPTNTLASLHDDAVTARTRQQYSRRLVTIIDFLRSLGRPTDNFTMEDFGDFLVSLKEC